MSLLKSGYPAHLSDLSSHFMQDVVTGGSVESSPAMVPSATQKHSLEGTSSPATREPFQFNRDSFGVVAGDGLTIGIGTIFSIFCFKLADQCFSDSINVEPGTAVSEDNVISTHNHHIWFAFFLGFLGVCVSFGLFRWSSVIYRSCALGVFYGGLATMALALYCSYDNMNHWGHAGLIFIVLVALLILPRATNRLVSK